MEKCNQIQKELYQKLSAKLQTCDLDSLRKLDTFLENERNKPPTYGFYNNRDFELDRFREKLTKIHWPASEISYTKDRDQYQELLKKSDETSKAIRQFVDTILSLFQKLDDIVTDNLNNNFIPVLSGVKEINDFLIVQANNELVHSQSYGDQMKACILDPERQRTLLNADPREFSSVQTIEQWTMNFFGNDDPIFVSLLVFACIEGIIFHSGFVCIYRLKELNIFPGITQANGLISRDEGIHSAAMIFFLKTLCKRLDIPLPADLIHTIIDQAVELGCKFAEDAVNPGMIGMKVEDLKAYVRHTGNFQCALLEIPNLYDDTQAYCSFEWMKKLGMIDISNFFEIRPTEYQESDAIDLDINLDDVEY